MTFTQTNSTTITQTGIDLTLSGLASVPGVITRLEGSGSFLKTRYYLPNGVSLIYEGTLSINPRNECLVFGTGWGVRLISGSTSSNLTIGSPSEPLGSRSEAIIFTDNPGNAYEISSGLDLYQGILNWYTGLIRCQTCIGIGVTGFFTDPQALSGSVLNGATIEIMARPSSQSDEACQIHFGGNPTMQYRGLTVRGFGGTAVLSIPGNSVFNSPPAFNLENVDGLTYESNSRATVFLTLYGFKSSGGAKELNLTRNSLTRSVNAISGSSTIVVEHNAKSGDASGYVEGRNEVLLKLSSSLGVATNIFVYCVDTNNGKRKQWNADVDNLPDFTYIQSTGSTGTASFLGNTASILLFAVANQSYALSGLNDSGGNEKDYRSISGTPGSDDFRFHCWGYEFTYAAFTEICKSDTVPLQVSRQILLDTAITLSRINAASRLTSNFTVNSSTGLITVIANSTLSELYDSLKSWKVQQANLTYPAITSQPVVAIGSELSTAMNITIGALPSFTNDSKFSRINLTGTAQITLTTSRPYTLSASIPSSGRVNIASGNTSLPNFIFTTGAIVNNTSSSAAIVTVPYSEIDKISTSSTGGGSISVRSVPTVFTGFPTANNINGYAPQSTFGILNETTNTWTTYDASSGSVSVSLSTLGATGQLLTFVADARGWIRTPSITGQPLSFAGPFSFSNLFIEVIGEDGRALCGLGDATEKAKLAYNQSIGTFELGGGGIRFAALLDKIEEDSSSQTGLTIFDTTILRQFKAISNPYVNVIALPSALKVQANSSTTISPVLTDCLIVVVGNSAGDPFTHSGRPEVRSALSKLISDPTVLAAIKLSTDIIPALL